MTRLKLAACARRRRSEREHDGSAREFHSISEGLTLKRLRNVAANYSGCVVRHACASVTVMSPLAQQLQAACIRCSRNTQRPGDTNNVRNPAFSLSSFKPAARASAGNVGGSIH